MDIYDILKTIIPDDTLYLSERVFNTPYIKDLQPQDQKLFKLLKNISSLGRSINNRGINFCPAFVLPDGHKAFSLEDLTENDYTILQELDYPKIPTPLKALIADLMWTEKRIYQFAKIATDSYWKIFSALYLQNCKNHALPMIRRFVCISAETNQKDYLNLFFKWLNDFIAHDILLDVSFSIRIIELYLSLKQAEPSLLLPALDRIIYSTHNNISTLESAYCNKIACLRKLHRNNDVQACMLELADTFVNHSKQLDTDDIGNVVNAKMYLEKAIRLYRDCQKKEKANAIQLELISLQELIPSLMKSNTYPVNIEPIIKAIQDNWNGLSFEESILRINQVIEFVSKDELETILVTENEEVLLHLFPQQDIDSNGLTRCSLPPLDMVNPKKNMSLFEQHLFQVALSSEEFIGNHIIPYILNYIQEHYSLESASLSFLTVDNPIIPKGRERIFQSAIAMFLQGDYYEAIQILAPQIENLFRNIAKQEGAITTTLESDNSSEDKTLGSILELPELINFFSEDIVFIFKGLLTEKAGSNIRNLVAHGILEEREASAGDCLYFGVALIKILICFSPSCMNVLKRNSKLHQFIILNPLKYSSID